MVSPEGSTDDPVADKKDFISSIWKAIKKFFLFIWEGIKRLLSSTWEMLLVFIIVVIATIVMLALMGPAIGKIFSNVTNGI
jgi:hypothetical protein